jgi:hypothetical protein
MTLRLNGSTSGYTEIDAPAVAGSNTIVLPSGNGSANQLLKNGSTAGSLEFSSSVYIDSSQRLLVGTSTARTNFRLFGTNYSSNIQAEGSEVIGLSATRAGGAFAVLGNSTTATSEASTGTVTFAASDGTNLLQVAEISALVDGTPGANDMPGRLVFSTTADGASSPTERMRITSAGNLFFGTTTKNITSPNNPGFEIHVQNTGGLGLYSSTTNNNITSVVFQNPNGRVGFIDINANSVAYSTTSDYRLKENVVPLTGAIDRINQLPVHRFNFTGSPNTTMDGFLAHEAQAVVPEAVTGEKDAVDDDGNPVYQGIDQSKLVPLLTAALQEALAEIESLKARVTALEP